MDSGLGSDDEKRNRTKAQKQLQNEQKQLFSSCFIDATSLGDEGEFEHRRNDERRQGALIFRSSIPQYSMLQMPHVAVDGDQGAVSGVREDKAEAQAIAISTPHNSIVQLEAEVGKKTPVGFYVDLGDVEVDDAPPAAPVEKKNIFSMVIDFNVPKREMPSRLSTSLYGRKKPSGSTSSRSVLTSSSSNLSEGISGSQESISRQNLSLEHQIKSDEEYGQNGTATESNDENLEEGSNFNSLPAAVETEVDNENKGEDKQDENVGNEKSEDKSTNEHVSSGVSNIPRPIQQFVKLSDLEAQSPRLDLFLAPRMSRSIPEKSWVESPLATFRSASYRSSPQPFQADLNEPGEPSSLTDSSTLPPRRSAQRLGTDLLRMFLEEIGPDVTLEVNSRKLRAHKCILSSRCQYFAAVFGGNPSENVVSIQGYSYAAVHFALCHIYSGAAHIPQSISLVELAALSDMLGLEGLKEVVAHALKVRHCHSFHKPCTGCITGVAEVLPLTAAYGLDELYQANLRWITQNFVEVWPNRTFANLPRELREKCYQQHVVHMSPDTVLETTVNCNKLLAMMPTAKWAEPIAQLTLQLADHCQLYYRQNFAAVLASPSFIELESQPDVIGLLEEGLLSAAGSLKLDQACRSYINCHKILQKTWSSPFQEMLRKIYAQVESCVVRQAAQASRSSLWMQLEPALRKRIRDLSAALTRSKAEPSNPLSSSSDSSRNSSPAVKSAQRTQVHSPSLRRSLLMAARTSQTPSSPSTCRRTSTLTNPTQSSAAKNTTKNISSQRVPSSKSTASSKGIVQRMPVKRETIVQKERPKKALTGSSVSVINKKIETIISPPRKNISSPPRKNVSSPPRKNISSPPRKNINITSARTSKKQMTTVSKQVVPAKQVEKISASPDKQPVEKQSPGVRRSGTFLKEGPTVLGKM